jgi:DNA-binding beta-propeller fold protein YncE
VVSLLFVACATNVPGIEPKDGEIRFPVGIAVHPAGRYLFVASSNFDLLYNGSTVGVVDLTTNAYVSGHTVKVGSFAADLVANAAGTTLFVPDRGTGRVNIIDVDLTASRFLSCSATTPASGLLPSCASSNMISVSQDPFSVAVLPQESFDGGTAPERLVVSHLRNGEVYVLEASDGGSARYNVVATQDFSDGTNAIAVRPDGDPTRRTVYVSHRFSNSLSTFRLIGDFLSPPATTRLVQTGTVSIRNPAGGLDTRGIAFNPTGTRAFVADRSPSSIVRLDTTLDSNGFEANRIVDVLAVGLGPASVTYVAGTGGTRDLLYVPCFYSDEVWVLDADLFTVTTVIQVGSGPYTFALAPDKRRGYVANFRDSTISVLDLDPTSPTYHRAISVIRAP